MATKNDIQNRRNKTSKRRASLKARLMNSRFALFWSDLDKRSRKYFVILSLTFIILTGLFITESFTTVSRYIENQFYIGTAAIGFTLDDVKIEGRVLTNQNDLIKNLDIDSGQPLFKTDLQAIQEQLVREIAWIDHVIIERHLPQTLYVRLFEITPLARWYHKDKYFVMSENKIIPISEETAKTAFKNLLLLKGDNAQTEATDFLKSLYANPTLTSDIKMAEFIEFRRWNLVTKNDTVIMLPEEDMTYALSMLEMKQKKEQILNRNLKQIDLRLKDRMIVKER